MLCPSCGVYLLEHDSECAECGYSMIKEAVHEASLESGELTVHHCSYGKCVGKSGTDTTFCKFMLRCVRVDHAKYIIACDPLWRGKETT